MTRPAPPAAPQPQPLDLSLLLARLQRLSRRADRLIHTLNADR